MLNNQNNDKMYIILISVHGLIRAKNMELGRDADTGGQTKYVVELLEALARDERVERVDLLTRQVTDSRVDKDYSVPLEQVSDKAYIRRITCGPNRYLRKERLWNYMDIFVDQTLHHIKEVGMLPDVVHGHYADAGYVGQRLARLFRVPFIFTGHSLGRVKKQRLLANGQPEERIENTYNISRRIEAEEISLNVAERVIASTDQEIKEQYEMYEMYDPARMRVIPPGVDLKLFYPPGEEWEYPEIFDDVKKFLKDPDKPMVLTVSRADDRKNIEGLIHAYGNNSKLRDAANLVIFAGNRDNIDDLDKGAGKVITNILKLIDRYELYGIAAVPKHNTPEDIQEMYRLGNRLRGVFVNPALTEPFGLTILEAGACGMPVVSTNHGGPNEIIGNCNNGVLVDPLDHEKMGEEIYGIISNSKRWEELSNNGLEGIEKYYSWRSHADTYLKEIINITKEKYHGADIFSSRKKRLTFADRLIITDIDDTLIGDEEALERFKELLNNRDENVAFGIATGRTLESARQVIDEYNIPMPNIFITSVGTEINYDEDMIEDETWRRYLDYYWNPGKITDVLDSIPGLIKQPDENQRKYKISYDIDFKKSPRVREIRKIVRNNKLKVNMIFSHQAYLDILPIRASTGLAARYLSIKWDIPEDKILAAGDSGSEEEMLRGNTLGVIVSNYSRELKKLKGQPRIYFAENACAGGILEGIEHYNFFGKIRVPEEEKAEE